MHKVDILPRLAEKIVRQRLSEFEVVMIEGPRQSGKTTLVKQFAGPDRAFLSCEMGLVKQGIDSDVHGYLAGLGQSVIIDEVQQRPELIRAIQHEVDERPGPGRFLITGSSSIHALRKIGPSLAGRECTLTLLPLCQAELRKIGESTFLDYLFSESVDEAYERPDQINYDAMAAQGGFPRLMTRNTPRQRSAWLRHYCERISDLDIPNMHEMRKGIEVRALLGLLAENASSKMNTEKFGQQLGIVRQTAREYLHIFKDLQMISLLGCYQPGRDDSLTRKQPKLQFNDSGLLSAILKMNEAAIKSNSRKAGFAGPLFECFVFSEIAKLCNARDDGYELYFWSYKEGEVDIVIHYDNKIVGVEVKRTRVTRSDDFKGLMKLAEESTNMCRGIVIYAGEQFSNWDALTNASGVPMQSIPAAWLWAKPSANQLDILEQTSLAL